MATQDISQLVVDVKSQGIQTAAKQLDKLATSADNAEAAVKKLGTAVVGTNGTLSGGVANATALVSSMTALTAVLERMAQSQTRAAASARVNNEAMAEAHALARGLSGSLGALWVTYGNLAGMGVGIALGASLKGVIGVGKDVEQTLEGIRVLGGATTTEMVKMSDAINSLGTGTSGPKEVAEALKTLTLAGLNAEQSLKGVGAALNLAIGGEVSIEKSAETLVQVGSALGYTAESFDHISDVIVKTAAASMSSVDSISGAFKSAAAVGTTYGASLQDIAVGLAAVANLGIQGTAAGTALKNLYKDLSASTQKVTQTLKDMHMSISSFRDAQGFMLPLVEVIQKLDEGFNRLSTGARNMAMVKMFGQQGLREGAALISLLHQAADDTERYGTKVDSTHNKLVELQDQIKESAATAKLAAIAMSQTTENQFKSVKNTLETTFSQVFTQIQPQIGAIARALKEAFASEEFKSGLKTVISLLVDFTKVLFDNAALLRDVAFGMAGAKFLEMASGIRAAAGAAATFNAALGPIGVAIAALTFAWQMYKQAKDRALSNKDAEGNLTDYVKEVEKETEKQTSLYNLRVKYGSDAAAQRAQEAKERREASQKAIDDAKAGVNALLKVRDDYLAKMSGSERAKAEAILKLDEEGQKAALEKRKFFGQQGLFDNIANAVSANIAYAESSRKVAIQTENAKKAVEGLIGAAGKNADWSDAEAKKNRIISPGDGQLSGKVDTKALNAAYNEAITAQQDIIKAASQALANFREQEQAKFKAGQIGQIQMINEVADAEVEAATKTAEAARAAQRKAESTPNKQADAERFKAEAERAEVDYVQAQKMRNQNILAAQRQMEEDSVRLKVKSLEDQGRFVEAAELKWSQEGRVALEQARADLAKYGDAYPELAEKVKAFEAVQRDAMNSAQVKEDANDFNTTLIELQGTLKGFKSESYGRSIGGIFTAATKASEDYQKKLEELKTKRNALWADAVLKGDPTAKKALAEADKEMAAMADKQKGMWQEVGDTISKSLGDAFGTAGTALGDLFKATLEYQNTENASAEDRMKQYGDMAQAASGFFDKQSKGYRVLNGIAQVFHVAQMARTMMQTAASVAAGAAQFFAQSGWGGFAGVAAMGAVMAGLGYAMSGASTHGADPTMDAEYVQKHQGTGTVLGDADAKSKSITDSISELKSNSDMMLPLTQGMLNSLHNIEDSMKGLAKLAVQSGITTGQNMGIDTYSNKSSISWGTAVLLGGVTAPLVKWLGGLWGKSSQEITDSGLQFGGRVSDLQAGRGFNQYANVKTSSSSWFGLSKSSSNSVQTQGLSSDISAQFGLVFSNLEDALKGAAGALGTNSDAVGRAIDNVVLKTTKISLKDLKGQELTDAINNVLSSAMDQIATAVYPQMQQFQQIGEGYAQTVVRVASGVEQAKNALEQLGVTAVNYADLTNKQGDVASEIVKQSLLDKETTTRVIGTMDKSQLGGVLGNIFKHFGGTTVTILQKDLSGIGEIIKNMTGSVEELTAAYKALDAIRTQMNLIGLNGNGLNLDMVKGAGGVSQLQSAVNTYQDKYFTDQEKSAIMLKSVTAEFAKLGVALPPTRANLRSLIEEASNSNPKLAGQLLALSGDYDKLMSAAEDANKATTDTLNNTIDGLKSFRDALKSLKDSLALGDLSILTPMQKFLEAQRQYEDTVAKAKAGDATAQGNVSATAQAYLDASRVVNASSQAYTDTYNQVMTDIDKLGASADTQLSNAEKQLAALQDQVTALDALNATASNMASSLTTIATNSSAPVTSTGTVAVDTSELQAEIKDLKQQLADAQTANAQALANLTAALFDANAQGAKTISDAVKGTASASDFIQQTIKKVLSER
jgi:TP901 family phage tail tape measure protein